MKRYLIPFLLVLGIQASTAQTDTATTAVDSTKKVIQISNEIKAVPGAKPQFKTELINAAANVEESANLMKAEASTSSVSALGAAGKTKATLDVSSSGGATFSIPITLPPGMGSAVPQLGLVYNSHGGHGTAGYGWNISGLSAISRIPSTSFHDGLISEVNFGVHDRFALDGQRLILKSGKYGADGAEYQTENYSNTKIISRGVSPYGASYGPQYFEVYLPDGTKAYYGLTQNSRAPADYAVTYTINPLGARINYTYRTSGSTLSISQITYGSFNSSSGINQINFSYVAANRTEKIYVGGLSISRSEILNKISVVANGTNFRHYQLTFNAIPLLNYQRLASIQEFDGGETEAFNPINFTYASTGSVITSNTISNLSLSKIGSNNSQLITSDFTGDGSMDFLLYPNSKDKFWAFYDLEPGSQYMHIGYEINIGRFKEIFPATWLTHNNKILAGQGMTVIKDAPNGALEFEMYSSGTVTPVYYQYDRMWLDVPKTPGYWSQFEERMMDVGNNLRWQFISGDFNGDALTDVIAIHDGLVATGEEVHYYHDPRDDRTSYYYATPTFSDLGSSAYFVNLDRRLTSNHVINLGELTESFFSNDKLYSGDFNGDGKSDILHVGSNNKMSVYTMNSENILELLWQTSDSRITNNQPLLMGDYNGDGKIDLMFSTGNNSLFATFMSTGKSFEKYERYQPFSNTAGSYDGTPGVERMEQYYLVPNDVDGDGKTDIISARTSTRNNNANGMAYITVYHNLSVGASQPNFVIGTSGSQYTNLIHYPIPIFLNPIRPNHKLQFGFMSDNSVSLFKFSKDFRIESQMTGVSQDGIYHQVEYKGLLPDRYEGNGVPLYQAGYNQTYPYLDLQSAPSMNVVSKLTRYLGSSQLIQVFGYGKAINHVGGMGYLGFGESIRSNWHTDDSDVNKMFNISINSPLLRGAPLKTFTSKSPYLSSAVTTAVPLPADTTLSLLVPNAQTIIAANSITLLPGFEAKGSNGDFIARINDPAQGTVKDGGTLSDYITRTDYAYNTQLLPNKVFVNVPKSVSTKDLLNQTNSLQLTNYDEYYNATKTTINFGGAGNKTVDVIYGNNPGIGYYIGRVLSTKTTLDNGSDKFTTSEEYSYTGFLATQIKAKGNNTPYTTENLVYDQYGNVTQKTEIASGGGQRTISMTYDPTGRFMTQNVDAEGMASSFVYDTSTGNVQSRTNPFNQTDTYLYDTWGRQISMTDFLNVKSIRSYQKGDNNTIIITDSDDEGNSNVQIVNSLGQTVESKQKTISGQFVGKASRFDVYGRLSEESQPGQPSSYNQWDQTIYDEYGRVKQLLAFTGRITNFSYNGLNTTVSDGTKSVTTTKNQLGQIVKLQDPGGTINYNYFANGNSKSTSYNGISQIIEQDGWGRKTKLTDPSSGVYLYEYDGFGQLAKETTPKGVTVYAYDAVGKLLSKKITGDETDMQCTYAYDATTKLLSSMNLTNADGNNAVYRYTYDANRRLSTSIEDNLHAQFVKEFTYDAYGRVSTESYGAKNKLNNIVVQKAITLHYQNGQLLQTTLQGSGQILWKVNGIDASGRISTALQGAALKTTFNYDTYGLPQQRTLDRISGSAANLMNLGYNFDGQRGILNSRSNSAFNWTESFNYDNLDRLTNFNDNNGNYSQTYDDGGRIKSNVLGDYSYQSNTYKQSELALSPAGDAYYQARALQQITWNAFKSPVEIIEQGRERISFQYNAGLGRSHMYYGGQESDKMLRRYRRHYAEDGSMEITNDFQNGITSFVFYLGGDGYTAPAIWKEVHGASVTKNLYYLHRDHLNSIVMITDEQGGIVEKRQFDAWGNIVQLTDGNNNALTTFLIIDRGFTGHEHLLGVGLIHMNGRLYDPYLHRFLSPDNFVQDPYNTQNFNRFGYALNNPLMFTDTSGEIIWAAVFVGMAVGALVGGASYVASAIMTGTWSWGALGVSILSGAVVGGVSGGLISGSPATFSVGKALGQMGAAFASGFLPSINGSIGNFNFSISPAIAFGKSFGVGANLSVGFSAGAWNIGAGVGVMHYGNYQGFGEGGTQIRRSLMAGYSKGEFSASLSTSFWKGNGAMNEFNQRTTMLSVRKGDWGFSYENDGSPFSYAGKILSNDTDMFRTAAVSIDYKDVSLKMNLFTGKSGTDESGLPFDEAIKDKNLVNFKEGAKSGTWKNGSANMYRLGTLSLGHKGYHTGINSEHIRNAFQNWFAHTVVAPQPRFKMLDKRWNPYFQYQSLNKYSLW